MHKNEERIIRYVIEAVEQGISIQEIKDEVFSLQHEEPIPHRAADTCH